MRDVPFSGIYWAGYEYFKKQSTLLVKLYTLPIDNTPNSHILSTWKEFQIAFLSGTMSGMIAAALTTPFDVVKTRRQVSNISSTHHRETASKVSGSAISVNYNRSMFTSLGDIARHEGFRALFAGFSARIVKVAPACGVMISSYVSIVPCLIST